MGSKKRTNEGVITTDEKIHGTITEIPIVTDAFREKYGKLLIGGIEKDDPVYFVKTDKDCINSNCTMNFILKETDLYYY